MSAFALLKLTFRGLGSKRAYLSIRLVTVLSKDHHVSSCEAECIMKCLLLGILACTHCFGVGLESPLQSCGQDLLCNDGRACRIEPVRVVEDLLSKGK